MSLQRLKLAPAMIVVFYGSLMTLGQALHYFPGFDHLSSLSGHSCSCHHCDYDTPADPSCTDTSGSSTSTEECQICQVLAYSQDVPTPVVIHNRDEQVQQLAHFSPTPPYCEPIRLAPARGPPLV